MKRLWVALLVAGVSIVPPVDRGIWGASSALAQGVAAKEAFEAAKELGTVEAWNAFLASFPTGFYADLARAYVAKLGGATAPAPAAQRPPAAAPAAAKETSRTIELGANANLNGMRLLPDDSPWHRDISKDRVDPNSAKILARIGLDKPLRADFGPEYEGAPMGIQYVVVAGNQKKVPITFTESGEESDPGPYPVPANAPIEGGPKGTGDRHVIVLDRDNWQLFELYNAFPDGGGWKAGGGSIWNLKENQVRPPGWTSADAAGLPILPGLVRYDEAVGKNAIEHAIRYTLAKTRRAYVPPASHWASTAHDDNLPPMGMRVRLKANFDISGFAPEVQAILRAIKTYGLILADNGSDNFISGAPDARWDVDILRQLMRVKTRDLEIVEMKDMVVDRRR